MKTPDMCHLQIRELATENAILFMWCTFPLLEDGLKVISAWGFKYTTGGFVWVKINPKSANNIYFMQKDFRSGLGSYTNSNVEFCLIGTKGKCLERKSKSVKQIILAPVLKHSQKPPETRERIVKLYGDMPRVELFARQKTEGWDVWGNEVKSDIKL